GGRTTCSRVMGTAESDRPTALVTGANRGLGLQTSNQLRAKGFRVILTSRDEKKGTASARGLDPAGLDVAYHQLDITDAASISTVDRKSTRLNSSHGSISYAVFCLKKKKQKE